MLRAGKSNHLNTSCSVLLLIITITAGQVISLSTWHHIAVTWSSDNGMFLYIDGAQYTVSRDNSISGSAITNDGILVIGQVGYL